METIREMSDEAVKNIVYRKIRCLGKKDIAEVLAKIIKHDYCNSYITVSKSVVENTLRIWGLK